MKKLLSITDVGIRKRTRFITSYDNSRVMKSVTYKFFLTETANMKTTSVSNYILEFDGVVECYVTLLRCNGLHCISFKFVVCDL